MRLQVRHRTTYRYDGPVRLALQRLRLWPPGEPHMRVLAWDVRLEGAAREAEFTDAHGNRTVLAGIEPGASEVVIEVTGDVETLIAHGMTGPHHGPPLWLYRRSTELTESGPTIAGLAEGFDHSDPLPSLHALSARIRAAMDYRIGSTHSRTKAEEAAKGGAGVCQDHAQAFCAAARLLGVPARYVSGYLRMDDRDEQEATHAWAEAHVADLGWVGFDVSNGYSPDERYVRLAAGLDYRDAAPVAGLVRGAGTERLEVSLLVHALPSQRQGADGQSQSIAGMSQSQGQQ